MNVSNNVVWMLATMICVMWAIWCIDVGNHYLYDVWNNDICDVGNNNVWDVCTLVYKNVDNNDICDVGNGVNRCG
jgi:hypothetical protein